MLHNQAKQMIDLIGEEKMLELCSKFPNAKLPGKKFCNRILRERFRNEFRGTDIKGLAEKYGVSIATLYNWSK